MASTDLTRDLLKRLQNHTADRSTVQQMWDAVTQYIAPYRGRFFQDQKSEHSINWFENRKTYDSTAQDGAKSLAASLHADVTSPAIQWFNLSFRNEKLNKSKRAAKWLQDVAEKIYHELEESNFDLEINKVYQDLVHFGTAAITLEEEQGEPGQWNGLSFVSIPLKEVYFEEDYKGNCARFYRCLEWTPQEIISKFGEDGVPDSIVKLEEDGNTDKIDVVFCIYPTGNKIARWGQKVTESERPWAYCYMLRNSADLLGKEGGYYEMPTFVPRWDTTNSSQWGNSPSMLALADVLSLNEAIKQQMRKVAKANDPPLLAEERAVLTDLNLGPGTVTVVRSVAGIAELPHNASSYDMSTEIARLTQNIQSYFLSERFDMPALDGQPRTATEWQIRYEHRQRFLAATFGHLRNDLLNPIVERSFNMLLREGQIPEPPDIVFEESTEEIDIEYLGALARAQAVDGVAAIERTMMSAASMAEVYPDGPIVVDAPEAIREIARKLNAPASMIRDEKEVEAIQQQQAEQAMAMQQSMQAQEEGKAMQEQAAGREAMA